MNLLDKSQHKSIKLSSFQDGAGKITTARPEFESTDVNPEVVESRLAPTPFQYLTPETVGQQSAIEQGDFGSVFQSEYARGLMGINWYGEMSPEEREDMELRAVNYAQENGVSAFFASMAGGYLSDLPTDIALMVTGAGAASVLKKVVQAGEGGEAMIAAYKAAQKIEDAYRGVGGNMGSRFLTRQVTEFATGALAAGINDQILKNVDERTITADETIDRMMMEGAAGALFVEALRGIGKGAKYIKEKVNEKLPEDQQIKNEESIEKLMNKVDEESPEDVLDSIKQSLGTGEKVSEMSGAKFSEQDFTGPEDEFFAVAEDGTVTLNPNYIGSIHNLAQEIVNKPELFGDDPKATKILGAVADRLIQLSSKVEGRTQADNILEVPFLRMGDRYADRNPTVQGAAHSRFEGAVRELMLFNKYGNRGSFVQLRSGLTPQKLTEVLTHEFMHLTTHAEIDSRIYGLKNAITGDQLDLTGMSGSVAEHHLIGAGVPKDDPLMKLAVLFKRAQSEPQIDKAGFNRKAYGFTDVHEFVSEAFSNPEFQEYLSGIEIYDFEEGFKGSKSTSLWDAFVEIISNMFNVKDRTVLSDTIKATDELFTRFVEEGVVEPDSKKAQPTRTTGKSAGDFREVLDKAMEPVEKPPEDGPTPEQQAAYDRIEADKEKVRALADKEKLKDTSGSFEDRSKLKWLREHAASIATTDNLTMLTMFKMMGELGEHMYNKLHEAINITSRIRNEINPHIERARVLFKDARSYLREEIEVDLEIATSFKPQSKGKGQSGESANAGEFKKIKMTRMQRLNLFMKIMDGQKKGMEGVEGETYKHASGIDMYKKNGGFELNGEHYVLNREFVKSIQRDPSILVDPKDLELAEAVWDGYRSAVGESNKVTMNLIGEDIFDPANHYYSPKDLLDAEEESEMFDFIRARMTKDKRPVLAGEFVTRKQTGGLAHSIDSNPLNRLEGYSYKVSQSLGYADLNMNMATLLNERKSKAAVKSNYGDAWIETMEKYQSAFLGKSEHMGKGERWMYELLSLRAQAILGYNPSVAMKQLGSLWSAVATNYMQTGSAWDSFKLGVEMTKSATRLANLGGFKNDIKLEREGIIAEAMQHSDWFRNRQETGHVNIDIADIKEDLGKDSKILNFAEGVLEKSGIKDFVVDKGGKVNEARLKHLGETMDWIRKLDEAALATLWETLKVQKFGEGGPKTPEEWAELTHIFERTAMESQPAYDMGTRTFNQMRKSLTAKAFNQFTTQTARNWNLAYEIALENEKKHRTPIDPKTGKPRKKTWEERKAANEELFIRLLPLLVQNAYISAVTMLMSVGTGVMIALAGGDENRKTRMDKAFPEWYKRFLVENINGVTGQVAGVGPFAKAISSKMMGAPTYGLSLPVVTEGLALVESVPELNIRKFVKNGMALSGIPLTPGRMTGLL